MALTHDPFVPTPQSKGFNGAQRHKNNPAWFSDMVAYMDHLAGRLITKIEKLGLSKETLIVFTGDNGTHPSITSQTKTGPYRGGKGGTKISGTHVPLIARWQGESPEGSVCDDLIDFTDFFPTLADVAAANIPAGHPMDGVSFLPQVRGQRGHPRDTIFCHYEPRWGSFQPARWAMDKRWKLYDDQRLYDLKQDPGEQNPLHQPPIEAMDAVSKLQAVLSKMQLHTGQ
jgi:arylsulfatase A